MPHTDPRAHAEYVRKWRAANPDKARAIDKRARQNADPEKVRARKRRYYAQNPQRFRAAGDRWIAAHPEDSRRIQHAWYEANTERKLDVARQWRQDNPEKIRAIWERNRARRAGSPIVERFSAQEIFERDGYVCHLCGAQCFPHAPYRFRPTVDHIVALVNGGEHSLLNVATAHQTCNSQKGMS